MGILDALGNLAVRVGVAAASKLAIAYLRTGGYIMNQLPVTLGIPLPQGPAARLITGPPTFLNPLGFPGMNSFLSGFAYSDQEEMVEGWLSLFGDVVLAPVPGVESSLEKALKALVRFDFITFGEEASDVLKGEVGLDDVAAFFQGVAQVTKDFQALGLPTVHPAPWIFGGVIGGIQWLDQVVSDVGGFLGGLVEGVVPTELPEVPPFDPDLPTTPEDVRGVVRAVGRLREGFPELLRVIDLLKRSV